VEFFKEAYAINRRALPPADVDALLADLRRPCSAAGSEAPPASRRGRSEGPPVSGAAPSVPEAACRSPQAGLAASASPARKAANEAAPKSLLERFGYGVQIKTQPTDARKPEPLAAPRSPPKRDKMIGISAGNNDLLERLAARRSQAVR